MNNNEDIDNFFDLEDADTMGNEPITDIADTNPDFYLFWNEKEILDELIKTKISLSQNKQKLKDSQAKNSQLKISNEEFRTIVIDLQEKLLEREGEYAKRYVKEYIKELEKKYIDETQPFVQLAFDEEALIKQIRDVVLTSNKDMYQTFMANTFDKIILKYKQVFIDRVDHYLRTNGLEQDLQNYVKKRLTSIMGKYKTEDLKGLIHFIIDDVAKKANIELSREIVKDMSEMQTIQVQTFEECLGKIRAKEQSYIADSFAKVKLLENNDAVTKDTN